MIPSDRDDQIDQNLAVFDAQGLDFFDHVPFLPQISEMM